MVYQPRPTNYLNSFYSSIIIILEKLCSGPYWKIKILFICVSLIFITTTPFFNFRYFFEGSSWSTIIQQANNILIPFRGIPGSHDANKVYRLAIPLLTKIFHLNPYSLFILQIISGLSIIYLLIEIVYDVLKDRVNTVLFLVSLSGCYISYSPFYDVFGRVDAFGYLFILLSVFVRRPFLVFIFCFFTAWCDERGLINTFFTLIYWIYTNANKTSEKKISLRDIAGEHTYAVVLSWMGYFFVRWILSYYFHFHTETSGVGLTEFSISRQFIPISIFSTYGSVWLIMIVSVLFFILKREWILLGLILIGLIPNLVVILMITDINRSLCYTIPFLIISLSEIHKRMNNKQIHKFLFIIGALSLVIPIYDFDGHLHYHPNIFIRIATIIVGVS
jgi:hypothetical protein